MSRKWAETRTESLRPRIVLYHPGARLGEPILSSTFNSMFLPSFGSPNQNPDKTSKNARNPENSRNTETTILSPQAVLRKQLMTSTLACFTRRMSGGRIPHRPFLIRLTSKKSRLQASGYKFGGLHFGLQIGGDQRHPHFPSHPSLLDISSHDFRLRPGMTEPTRSRGEARHQWRQHLRLTSALIRRPRLPPVCRPGTRRNQTAAPAIPLHHLPYIKRPGYQPRASGTQDLISAPRDQIIIECFCVWEEDYDD
jgi:hypothetical protein